jgi:uncharacterized membrane protein
MKQRGRLRIFGHPVHPVVTHFPMALLPVSLLGDLLGVWTEVSFWWSFSFYSLSIGLIMSIPTLLSGLIDFLAIPQKGYAERVAMRHMTIMISAIMMYTGSFFIRLGVEIPSGWWSISSVSLSLLGLIFLLVGGWFGGQLVYRYGVGGEPIFVEKDSGKS